MTELLSVDSFSKYEPNHTDNSNNLNWKELKFNSADIRSDHKNQEEKHAIHAMVREYADVFHVDGKQLPFTSKIEHSIESKDDVPVYTQSYRYPHILKKRSRILNK